MRLRVLLPLALSVTVSLTTPVTAEETFRDRALAGGVDLSAPKVDARPPEVGVILRGDATARNEWLLGQWGTRLSLAGASQRELPGGTRIIRNGGKTVTVHPGGLAGEGVALAVNGGAEYSGLLRRDGDTWPRLLLEQRIPKNFRIADFTSLNFNLSFRVDFCTLATDFAALDPALHNAQLAAVWTLHNRNQESADYLDTIEFGVPLFDARHDVPPAYQMASASSYNGPESYIYRLEGTRFFDAPTGDGSWHTVQCNLVPLVEEALQAAKAEGLLTNTELADLHASSFDLGWELPGPFECSATLKDLSLYAEKN